MNEEVKEEAQAANRKNLIYKMKEPINWDNGKGSELITEIKFMKPKGKHVKMLKPEPSVSDLLMMASKLSLISHKFFDEIASEDAFEIASFVGELL